MVLLDLERNAVTSISSSGHSSRKKNSSKSRKRKKTPNRSSR